MQDLRCTLPEHNKKKFVSISLQDQVEKRLFCFQCQSDASAGDLAKSQLLGKLKLCDLDEVMEGNPYSVYNWPADDEGVRVKEYLVGYKSLEQQRKDIEDFFAQMKGKLNEQVENVKQLLIEALNATQFIRDEKLKQEDPKKEDKKDEKKDTKKEDPKKEAKKDDKKDDKKDTKKEEKKVQGNECFKQIEEKLDQTPTIENLKKHYELVYDLTRLKVIIKENAKSDPNLLSGKIHEYLNDQRRQDQLISLKKVFQGVLGGKNGNNQIQSSKIVLDSYYEQILNSMQQWTQKFGRVTWRFDVSKADASKQVKKLTEDGREFCGAGTQSQIVYSDTAFSDGQHGCIVLFKEFDQKRAGANGNFYVGVVSEESKDKSPYGQGFRKDLFSANGEGLNVKIGSDFNNIFKTPPKLLAVKLDIDNNHFEVCDGKRTVVYGLDKDSKLKGQKWRVYIWWNIAADRVQLIHSY